MNRILLAARMARAANDGQTRKYNWLPYILHPARVAARTMLLYDATEDLVCAAWLHDVLEDCEATEASIREEFGDAVTHLVGELTNPSKGRSDLSRAERKALDRGHIGAISRGAKQIKLIDRIDNLRELAASRAPADFAVVYAGEMRLLAQVLLPDAEPTLYSELEAAVEALLAHGQRVG